MAGVEIATGELIIKSRMLALKKELKTRLKNRKRLVKVYPIRGDGKWN